MNWIYFIVALPVLLYAILLAWLLISFVRHKTKAKTPISGLTVLIPFKNESVHLPKLLNNLKGQSSEGFPLEIVFIDDGSNDGSKQLIEGFDYSILSAPDGVSGKKACMRWAMNQAACPWILTLDVDIELPAHFFSNFSDGIQNGRKYMLIPIKPQVSKGWVSAFFDLEFLALHFVGLASASAGQPLLSNAACTLFEKEAFEKSATTRTDWDIASGDDVFAMFSIADMFGKSAIGRMPWSGSMATVSFPKGAKSLWLQRLRWVSKSGAVKNVWFSIVSVLTFVFNICLGFLTIKSLATCIPFWVVVLAIAAFTQTSFLIWLCAKWQRKDLLTWIIPSVFIYPFYLLALVITQYFWKPKWK